MNLVSKDISDDFPNSDKIYLNSASVSLMPSQSIEAMKEFQISYNSIGPDSKDSELFVTEKLQNVRKIIGLLIELISLLRNSALWKGSEHNTILGRFCLNSF